MKNVTILLLAIGAFSVGRLAAQSEAIASEKMKVFTNWVGDWQGEGAMQMGPGDPKRTTVHEQIKFGLGESILVIEGIGRSTDPATGKEIITHHAFGILSWDQVSQEYKFRSYLKDGRMTDAWVNFTDENHFGWGFDTPHGKIKYTVVLDPLKKTWNEVGEFSSDGKTWNPFFEMNLVKTK